MATIHNDYNGANITFETGSTQNGDVNISGGTFYHYSTPPVPAQDDQSATCVNAAQKTFDTYISPHERTEEVKRVLHCVIDGRKGRFVALALLCALQKGWLTEKPHYRLVKDEFGDIGSKSGFNKYLQYELHAKESFFKEAETEALMKQLVY